MGRKKVNRQPSSLMTSRISTSTTKDYSADRPRATVVADLPRNALYYGRQSVWENIALMLWNNVGKWVQLQRVYSSPSSPVQLARKVIADRHGDAVAETLRSAYVPIDEGKVVVYLMLDYHEPQPEREDLDPDSLNMDFDNENPDDEHPDDDSPLYDEDGEPLADPEREEF